MMEFARKRLKTPLNLEIWAFGAVVLLGLALRIRQLTVNISLWLDEAMLALNIVQRNFAGLARPLDYEQGAPLGYLWLVKLSETVLGNHEYSLRLVAFLAGCAALVLLPLLARQLIQPMGAFFALLLFAVSRYAISYSAQVKQYSLDAALTLGLTLFALYFLRGRLSAWRALAWALIGAAAIWLSHAAVFSLAGIGLVLLAERALRKDWRGLVQFSLAALFWLLNFAALYFFVYHSLANDRFMTDYWSEYFMPLSLAAPGWALQMLAGLFNIPGAISTGGLTQVMLFLFACGAVSLAVRERFWIWTFILTLLVTLAASSLGKYPFGGRLCFFLLPGMLICAGEGIQLIIRLFGRWQLAGRLLALLVLGLLAYSPTAYSLEQAFQPKMTENIAPTMAYLQANYRAGDVIYLYPTSIPAFRYYAPRYHLEQASVFEGTDYSSNRAGYQAEVDQLALSKRVWFLFSHLTDPVYTADRDFILHYASLSGQQQRAFSLPGTLINLYLFTFLH